MESKWEYMGFGIWENRDPDDPSPPTPRRFSSETSKSMQTVQSRASNGYQVALDGTSASTATAGLLSLFIFATATKDIQRMCLTCIPSSDIVLSVITDQ